MRRHQRGALSALHVTGVSLLHDVKIDNRLPHGQRNLCSLCLDRLPTVSHQQAGGARRDRTDDLLLAKQALSQLSYGPSRMLRLDLSATFQANRMVGLERFELSTSRLSSARSNQLSYRPDEHARKRSGRCPSEERETKAAVSRKWSQRLAPHLAPDVSKHRERPKPRWPRVILPSILRKEVIQPQVPLRLPCYDFTPVADLTVAGCLLAVSAPSSGKANSHGVTGGVYKARERIHRSVLICDY